MIKSRFSPSPTGYMHLGNARTALFNALLAIGKQGVFLLRIEDTDKARSNDEYTAVLQQDLQWLGLAWQEGPGVGGDNGPYWQSQRQAIYDCYYQRLEQKGLVYPCFCSDEQLALTRKVQLASGQAPRYPGTCRALTPQAITQKRAQGVQATLRFHVPKGCTVEFTDLVHGLQRFHTDNIGDFIIRRADGTASFIFCNAIDDALMGVTHALRGEDHLTNTPRQLLLLQALELQPPQYSHMPMIVGKEGSPLSKRHGSRSITELREQGFLPEAIVNYLSRLGHYYEIPTFMELAELAKRFSLSALGKSPARFDADQLLYWQKEALLHIHDDKFWKWIGPAVHTIVPAQSQSLFIETIRPNVLFPIDALHWAQIFFKEPLIYSEEAKTVLRQTESHFFQAAVSALDSVGIDFAQLSRHLQQVTGMKGKALYQPLRVALTGETKGPEMGKILELLGVEIARGRLQHANMTL